MPTTAGKILILLDSPRWAEPPPTAAELADRLGVTAATASTALRMLENLGRVRKVGEASTGARTWALIERQWT